MPLTGKQRSRRIDRAYYQSLDPYVRIKRTAGWIALGLGILWSIWLFTPMGKPQLNPGDLSHAHSAWNKQGCEACHEGFATIRSDSWGGREAVNVAVNNATCNGKCHAAAGHYELRTDPTVTAAENCTLCHREHMGREASLVQLADSDCSRCHRDIAKFVAANTASLAKNVNNFSRTDGHPEFKGLAADPGRIKFSHILHLKPGQAPAESHPTAKSFAEVDTPYRDRYAHGATPPLDQLIQLRCSDCHEPDVETAGLDALQDLIGYETKQTYPSNSHRFYKPVNFEKHCVACHNLDDVPHGLDREQTKQAVAKLLPARQLEYFRDKLGDAPQPAEEDVRLRQSRLEALLAGGGACLKCHEAAPADDKQLVAPSRVPQQWFRDAAFNHGAHLMMGCRECHPQAFETELRLRKTENGQDAYAVFGDGAVMIQGIESCRQCHIRDADERSKIFSTKKIPVATADCVDCHRYHIDPPKGSPNIATTRLEEYLSLHGVSP